MTWKPDYATSAELRHFLRIPDTDTDDDDELGLALAAASRAIDYTCQRQFGKLDVAASRVYTAQFDRAGIHSVEIEDLMTTTDLVVGVSGTPSTAFTKRPFNAPVEERPWTSLVFDNSVTTTTGAIEITAKWGWTDVPNTIRQATLLQASRFFKRRDAPFGVAGSPEMGNEMRLLAKVDPDVEVMVASYRRWWGAR